MFIQKTFKNQLPTLYLVGTPIGNLDDLSFRALKVFNEVETILCEDTRTSLTLLNKYDIKKSLLSLHKFNELQRVEQITSLLNQKQNLAMISDAGLPTISDPGNLLIHQLRWVKNLNFNLTAVNAGPAYLYAVVSSGFTNSTNYFYGFIKNKSVLSKSKELQGVLANHRNETVSFYESVHRIIETLKVLNDVCDPKTRITLNRELTKINEEIIYGSINEVYQYAISNELILKGEFVIVIDNQIETIIYDDLELLKLVSEEIANGLKINQAAKKVSEITKVNKNYIYDLFVKNK